MKFVLINSTALPSCDTGEAFVIGVVFSRVCTCVTPPSRLPSVCGGCLSMVCTYASLSRCVLPSVDVVDVVDVLPSSVAWRVPGRVFGSASVRAEVAWSVDGELHRQPGLNDGDDD